MMRYFWIICVGLLSGGDLYAQIKAVRANNGNWNAPLTTTITEAGSNYTANITSATNQTLFDVDGEKNNDPFTVTIQRQDTDWNSTLTLWARRTGAGVGGTITGGLNYVQLTTNAQYFFNGTVSSGGGSKTTGVPIQYEIQGAFGTDTREILFDYHHLHSDESLIKNGLCQHQ